MNNATLQRPDAPGFAAPIESTPAAEVEPETYCDTASQSMRWSKEDREQLFDARLHRICGELLAMAEAVEDYRDREEPASAKREMWLAALESALAQARAAHRCLCAA